MPSASSPTESRAQSDSWPPTQIRLHPSVERNDAEIDDLDLSKIDEDPLVYFLTPTTFPDSDDDDGMDFEMDFDAGIEDAKHPPPVVRSVSPSSLGGLSHPPPPRSPTPPRSPSIPDLALDSSSNPTPEDADDYMQFAARSRSHSLSFPVLLKDFTTGKSKVQQHNPNNGSTDALLSPASFYISGASDHGQSARPRGRTATLSPRRSPHSWREPSPDVWSIEEEAEGGIDSDMGEGTVGEGERIEAGKARAIQITAAKPKKRVRFMLPE
ncbi:hypothetical protein B0T17DRAFT_612542 [Bombardia bombarda]|uniref:Uncharacterized protein n=1 Tax=Bombardia bombarda TaxID=252184 RepID=A0AA40CEX4_9PEZI|nr:hypothetical protein B0T17DRAFT_612542 [Bombardia bombarda]